MNKKDETTILLNVLSLEDSSGDFEIISEKLISAGYILNISRVEKESEFISLTKKNRYDIILADYNLPGFNAFEALKICKEQCPEVPVICVSGSIGEITAIELLKQGAVDYVLKDRLERLPFAIKRALAEAKEKTNRQKAEEALRESEERLRDIIFSTADWVWEIDENAVFTYSSQRGEELFDMPQEEIIGKTPFDFMPKEEARRTKKIFSELLKNKAPVVDLENWNIGKNGQKICLLTNARPIFNNKGELKGYRGVDKNITERKLAEEAIRQSEAELNYAQEIAKMGSWQYHFTTKKFRWSRNMYLLFGYKSFEKEISLDEFKEHVHPEDRYLIDLSIQKTIATRTGLSFDFRYILPDGETIWLQNNMSPTFRNNKLLEIQGVNINITKKKIAEQELIKAKEKAEASDRLKTAFMNNISHEIRTPLNGILGFGQMLTNPDIAPDLKENYYRILNSSSDRLLNTVTNFLDISLLTSGNQKIYRKNVALENLLDEVCSGFTESCEEKQLTLLLQKPESAPTDSIYTDRDLLGKILHQLIDNAVKFTTKGSITVGYKKLNGFILFHVQDTGMGISEENRKLIFSNFTQGDTTDTRVYEGTGLGLSIAKGLTELLGGMMCLESEKDKGSTFYFSVPSA